TAMVGARGELERHIASVHIDFVNRAKHFDLVRRSFANDLADTRAARQAGQNTRTVAMYPEWGGGHTQNKVISDLDAHIVQREHDIRVAESAIDLLNSLRGTISEVAISSTVEKMKALAAAAGNEWPRSTIEADAKRPTELIDAIRRFRGKLFPPSLKLVFSLLGWLCVVSIIWPLSALPSQ